MSVSRLAINQAALPRGPLSLWERLGEGGMNRKRTSCNPAHAASSALTPDLSQRERELCRSAPQNLSESRVVRGHVPDYHFVTGMFRP
jgi:hypothetical protein